MTIRKILLLFSYFFIVYVDRRWMSFDARLLKVKGCRIQSVILIDNLTYTRRITTFTVTEASCWIKDSSAGDDHLLLISTLNSFHRSPKETTIWVVESMKLVSILKNLKTATFICFYFYLTFFTLRVTNFWNFIFITYDTMIYVTFTNSFRHFPAFEKFLEYFYLCQFTEITSTFRTTFQW